MTPIAPRRWFQFGLRTMFLAVTVFAVWLGWELTVVRERQTLRRFVEMDDGMVMARNPVDPNSVCAIPWWRTMLGDESAALIVLGRSKGFDEAKIRAAFPEVELVLPHALPSDEGAIANPAASPWDRPNSLP